MYGLISSLFSNYAKDIAYGGLMQAIEKAPLGMGTGTNTGAARYAVSDPSVFIGIENYYAKAAVELGIPGLLVVVGLFVVVIVAGLKAHRSIVDPIYRCCSNALLAFAIVIFLNSFKGWLIDLDPLNIYYWLFAGILLKLSVLEQAQSASEYTEEYSLAEVRT
jgi:O-antigen ligase